MIDIKCSREGIKCTDCPIKRDCDFIEVTEDVDPYAFYKKGRADERAKVIEEISKEVTFEEKWLLEAIREDKGNYTYNIDIAFSGIKNSLNKLDKQELVR